MPDSFYEGLEVFYKERIGTIRFIGDSYLTMCIHTNVNPLKDVCIVIPKNEWSSIQLVKGNRNSDND